MPTLFDHEPVAPSREPLEEGAVLLRRFATPFVPDLLEDILAVAAAAPFRQMQTPGGRTMSVAMTNCGPLGWITDRKGYRYEPADPTTAEPWPALPPRFLTLAQTAAAEAGFPNFTPEACLINRYLPSTKMGLHQDRDEQDQQAPIVSVSLGLPATFQWGGQKRSDPVRKLLLESGDVVVWGGPARFVYHGVAPLKDGVHPLTGAVRYNLTFRKVN